MPSILSKELAAKLLGQEWSFGYNCYEVGHTWTPSCTGAALEVSMAAAIKILPLYAALYLFSQLAVQQSYEAEAGWETLKSTIRSTLFIFFHAYNGSILGCALRRGFGRFYYRVLVCAPALLSSYLSLLVEKPSRRQALAFYVLNMASEIVYRMAVTKGYFKPVWQGETLLFAASLAAWYYLLKVHGFGHDPTSVAFKVLIGRDEAKSRARRQPKKPAREECRSQEASHPVDRNKSMIAAVGVKFVAAGRRLSDKPIKLLDYVGNRWLYGRHESCPHTQDTCFRYVAGPIPSRLAIGIIVQSLLKLASKPYELLFEPKEAIRKALTSGSSLRFGMFLATLVASGRLTSCMLRRYSQSNEPHWHGLVSGAVAGLSMFWAPRPSISMYVMWKAIEQYYLLMARHGHVSHFNLTIATIYAFSVATILYTFALEPRFVRPSYMKFLDNMSEHRLHQLNRMVLDVFGTGSSIGYEDYFPDLDPKYMSNQFKELVFNWIIQPY